MSAILTGLAWVFAYTLVLFLVYGGALFFAWLFRVTF